MTQEEINTIVICSILKELDEHNLIPRPRIAELLSMLTSGFTLPILFPKDES